MSTVTEIEVRERPIIFSGEMVRAILEGRKTQTRRVAKVHAAHIPGMISPDGSNCARTPQEHVSYCPYGQRGDRLWVRESIGRWESGEKDSYGHDLGGEWFYKADEAHVLLESSRTEEVTAMRVWAHHKDSSHCPSIHMPRWASRITLEITSVRVERVQEISHEDALAEGCRGYDWVESSPYIAGPHTDAGELPELPAEEYRKLWDSINAKRGYGWSVNPWVWVISFRRLGA